MIPETDSNIQSFEKCSVTTKKCMCALVHLNMGTLVALIMSSW